MTFLSPGRLALAALLICSLGCQTTSDSPTSDSPTSDNKEVQNRGEGKDQWWDALPRAAWSEFRRIEQSQPWFEVHEIRPGVLAIYEPGQFEEVISYLIVGSQQALLFDTGLGIGDIRRLVGELTEREVMAGAVDTVLPAHNEPTLPGSELVAFGEAFNTIEREGAPFVLTDGNREYDFGRFSILVSDPPPWSAEP